jgi:hypothetical protein
VLWPSGASVVMFNQAVGWIGSPSRGEPLFEFQDVDAASITLTAGDHVRLLGGALLHGDSGPYLVERVRTDILCIKNQSKSKLTLAFRDDVFDLAAGQQVSLPVVSTGTAPIAAPPDQKKISGRGYDVLVAGRVTPVDDANALHLSADGPVDLEGLGVRVHLESGESAAFSSLGSSRPSAPKPPISSGPATNAPANAAADKKP